MSGAHASRRRRAGSYFPVTLLMLLAYAAAYDECVRRPTPIAFHRLAWPYYAIGQHGWWGVGEYRLPEKPAEAFFFPANWIDRQIHPNKWAEKRPVWD
ncbi:MAG TPA: hypothetical protein VFG04_15130 [Planctomycetaceae bacterium]|jgi:hypothetical protein|nr:hypothetical protein [Planctomycetaceae bacterium]